MAAKYNKDDMNFKPIKADDTEKKFKEKYYGHPAKGVKVKKDNRRKDAAGGVHKFFNNIGWWFQNKAKDLKWYLDDKAELGIKEYSKQMAKSTSLYVGLAIIAGIIFILVKVL